MEPVKKALHTVEQPISSSFAILRMDGITFLVLPACWNRHRHTQKAPWDSFHWNISRGIRV
ncbi:hypothetical protein DSECCO2_205930 [anaerobic digester metagenome]